MRKELSAPSLAIAVAVYVPEQYARLLATAEDASDKEAPKAMNEKPSCYWCCRGSPVATRLREKEWLIPDAGSMSKECYYGQTMKLVREVDRMVLKR